MELHVYVHRCEIRKQRERKKGKERLRERRRRIDRQKGKKEIDKGKRPGERRRQR